MNPFTSDCFDYHFGEMLTKLLPAPLIMARFCFCLTKPDFAIRDICLNCILRLTIFGKDTNLFFIFFVFFSSFKKTSKGFLVDFCLYKPIHL